MTQPTAQNSGPQGELSAELARQRQEWPEQSGFDRLRSALAWGRPGELSLREQKNLEARQAQDQDWARALGRAGFSAAGDAKVLAWSSANAGWEGEPPGSFSIGYFCAPKNGRVVMLDEERGRRAGILSRGIARAGSMSREIIDPDERFWMRKLEQTHELGHLALAQRARRFGDDGLLSEAQRDALEIGLFGHLAESNWAEKNLSEAGADCWGALTLLWSAQGAPGAWKAVETLLRARQKDAVEDMALSRDDSLNPQQLKRYYHTEAAIKMAIARPEEWMGATPAQIEERAFRCASLGLARALRSGKPFVNKHGEWTDLENAGSRSVALAWDEASAPDFLLRASAGAWRAQRALLPALPETLAQSAGGRWLAKHEAAYHEKLDAFARARPQSELAKWRADDEAPHNASMTRLGRYLTTAADLVEGAGELRRALEQQSRALRKTALDGWETLVEIQAKAMSKEAMGRPPESAPETRSAIKWTERERAGMKDIQDRLAAFRERAEKEKGDCEPAPQASPGQGPSIG